MEKASNNVQQCWLMILQISCSIKEARSNQAVSGSQRGSPSLYGLTESLAAVNIVLESGTNYGPTHFTSQMICYSRSASTLMKMNGRILWVLSHSKGTAIASYRLLFNEAAATSMVLVLLAEQIKRFRNTTVSCCDNLMLHLLYLSYWVD